MPKSPNPKALTKEERSLKTIETMQYAMSGLSTKDIANKVGLSIKQVRTIKASDDYKKAVEEVQSAAKTKAKLQFLGQMDSLMAEALQSLKKRLEGAQSDEAIKIVLKAYGVIDSKEEKEDKDTELHVHFSGFSKPEEKDV